MLMRFDPFRDGDPLSQLLVRQPAGARQPTMPMDAYRDGDRFVVKIDLPGVDPSAINITVEKNVLTVQAERSWEPREDQEVLVQERPQGGATRRLFLGEGLDPDHVEATYDHGVLTIAIPVAEKAKPHRVEVTTRGGEETPIPAGAMTNGSPAA